ncbi:MAG: 23S rRNA (pseudouridine(1915)-N(3))-methyltransferase RlmH [Lachnospiraceae bacterium]|nr:23S rRNA (pseudouridine(1915)-N(3))-methyltransferase RlmH [Lachnospiraceae bacterium]
MNISIVCVGKIKEKYFRDALEEYVKRLSKFAKISVFEVDDEETPANASAKEEENIKDKEAERIIKKIPSNSYLITLEIDGRKYDSVSFAKRINTLCVNGNSSICFVIGGSLGLSDKIKAMSNEKISFSDMTFPHQLMRVILSEQIYRAFKILNNEPYHK